MGRRVFVGLDNKAATHHKDGSAPDVLLPVESGGELHFYNGPSLLGNGDGNDTRAEDQEGRERLPKAVGAGCGTWDPEMVWKRVTPGCRGGLSCC